VESINSFVHVAHDRDDSIHDATESYYKRGKHGLMDLNNIKFPLFILQILKLHLFYLSVFVTMCLVDLFSYKILCIGSGLDLNVFYICFLMLSLASSSFVAPLP
jgi:hypothetical protein